MYYTISIGMTVIHQVLMGQLWSPWTVSAPSLMDLQTQTSSVAVLAWNSIVMITHVRVILPFMFALCFGFTDNLWYCLSQPDDWFALHAGIPALTSSWIFDHIRERLCAICNSNTEISPPRQYAAPAAHIQAFVNGTIATPLPDQQW
jgi:hypothetical protein